jgi:hypothetical protein
MNFVKYAIVFTDENGDSHFKDGKLEFELVNFAPPSPLVGLSNYFPTSQLVFCNIPPGWFGDWHPAPKRQFFCCLAGQIEVTVGDGEKRVFRVGDVLLVEDTTGRGHVTRVTGETDFLAAIVQLTT